MKLKDSQLEIREEGEKNQVVEKKRTEMPVTAYGGNRTITV